MWSYHLIGNKGEEYILNVYYDHYELRDCDGGSVMGGNIDKARQENILEMVCESCSLKKVKVVEYMPYTKIKAWAAKRIFIYLYVD